jgi:hypothetical protein
MVAAPVLAETPNLQPGLWSYTNSSTIEGPMSIPPQTTSNQECLKQEDLDKGVDMLDIPQKCTVTKADIFRDSTDFAATCDMGGLTSLYKGHASFHGDHLKGKMRSEMNTPLGKVIMNMDFKAKRIGEC